MTTLLTLSSSFASLATVTPPISYTTRLDIWMVTCIVFVFLTMAEFTLVIILKYYLVNHIPVFCFQHLLRQREENFSSPEEKTENENISIIKEFLVDSVERASAASTVELLDDSPKENCDIQKKATYHSCNKKDMAMEKEISKNKISPPMKLNNGSSSTTDDKYLNEEKERISLYIINIIEKNSVFVFLLAFLTFNVVYWRDIYYISKDLKKQFDNNTFISS